jgi:hypothetical protein
MKNIVFLLVFLNLVIKAQNVPQWEWDSLLKTQHYRLEVDKVNNFYLYGSDTIKKFNASHSLLWTKSIKNGSIGQLISCENNDILIAGNFTGLIEADHLSAQSRGPTNGFVIRLNENGNPLWLKTVGSKKIAVVSGIAASNEHIFITGTIEDTAYFTNQAIPKTIAGEMFIAKYQQNGVFISAKFAETLNPGEYHGSAGAEIKVDNNNDVILLMNVTGKTIFDSASFQGDFFGDLRVLMKLGKEFDLKWYYIMPGAYYETFFNLKINTSNDIYLIEHTYNPHYDGAGSIWKISTQGQVLLTPSFTIANLVNAIEIDPYDNVIFAGWSAHHPFDTVTVTNFHVGMADPNLNIIWQKSDTGSAGCNDIRILKNTIILAGRFSYSLKLKDLLNATDENDGYLAFLNYSHTIDIVKNKLDPIPIILFPNPSPGIFSISNMNEPATVCVYDVQGKRVCTTSIKQNKIDLSLLNKGIYFLLVNNAEGVFRKKIVIE